MLSSETESIKKHDILTQYPKVVYENKSQPLRAKMGICESQQIQRPEKQKAQPTLQYPAF